MKHESFMRRKAEEIKRNRFKCRKKGLLGRGDKCDISGCKKIPKSNNNRH